MEAQSFTYRPVVAPGTHRAAHDEAGARRDVCAAADIADKEIKAFDVLGVRICISREGDRLRAFQENCTHRRCPLTRGEVEDDVVFCPCHDAEFDLGTGAVLGGPATKPLPVYECGVEAGRVWVRLPDETVEPDGG